jgi:hypothetical protein
MQPKFQAGLVAFAVAICLATLVTLIVALNVQQEVNQQAKVETRIRRSSPRQRSEPIEPERTEATPPPTAHVPQETSKQIPTTQVPPVIQSPVRPAIHEEQPRCNRGKPDEDRFSLTDSFRNGHIDLISMQPGV